MGRHDKDHRRGPTDTLSQGTGRLKAVGQAHPGQVAPVLPERGNLGDNVGFEGPQPYPLPFSGHEPGESRPPGAGPNDGHGPVHFRMSWRTVSRSSFNVNLVEVSVRSGTNKVA